MKKITKLTLFFLFFINSYVYAQSYNEKINSNNELFIGQITAPAYSRVFDTLNNRNIDFYLGSQIEYEDESSHTLYKFIIDITFPDLPYDLSKRKLIIPFLKGNLEKEGMQNYVEDHLGLNQLDFITKKYREWYQVVIDNNVNDYFKLIGADGYYPDFFFNNSIDLARFAFSKQPNLNAELILLFSATASKQDYYYNQDIRWAEYYLNFNQVKQLENLLDKDFLLSKISELEKQENIDEMFN